MPSRRFQLQASRTNRRPENRLRAGKARVRAHPYPLLTTVVASVARHGLNTISAVVRGVNVVLYDALLAGRKVPRKTHLDPTPPDCHRKEARNDQLLGMRRGPLHPLGCP